MSSIHGRERVIVLDGRYLYSALLLSERRYRQVHRLKSNRGTKGACVKRIACVVGLSRRISEKSDIKIIDHCDLYDRPSGQRERGGCQGENDIERERASEDSAAPTSDHGMEMEI